MTDQAALAFLRRERAALLEHLQQEGAHDMTQWDAADALETAIKALRVRCEAVGE